MSQTEAQRAVEHAARDGYGRLVAWLAARCGDLPTAEDAVGEALEAALRSWPNDGVPARPEAWLLTAARRKVIDRVRRQKTRLDGAERLRLEAQEAAEVPFRTTLPDRRLELLFVCAHPEIETADRTPLMLQTVLGVSAERIASAMLQKPATLGQRLVRAKRRIKQRGLVFEVPPEEERGARLGHVLDAIYAAYGTGWESAATDDPVTGLATEAVWLARLVVSLMPEAAEAKGLLALMLYCESRREARRVGGAFVPLEEQDTSLWDLAQVAEAEYALGLAANMHAPGPYQHEAAIQSVHAHRARTGVTDWAALNALYRVLVAQFPSLGAWIGLAASCGRVGDAEAGLAILDGLPDPRVRRHQPYWAVRAYLLSETADLEGADAAYGRAIGLTEDPAVRRWLAGRRGAT